MTDKETYFCRRCGHSWHPRKLMPKQCPQCHSPYWRIRRGILPFGRPPKAKRSI